MCSTYRAFSYLIVVASLATPIYGQTNASVTSLSVSPASIPAGDFVVTLSATVIVGGYGAAQGGTVQFLDGTRSVGTVQVIVGVGAGRAVLKTNSFAVGTDNITAVYSGAPNSSQKAAASSSSPVTLVVQSSGLYASATTFTATQKPQGKYDLTATVYGVGEPTPSGFVDFFNQTGRTSLGPVPLHHASAVSASFPALFQASYPTGANPASIAVGDFNQDGTLDFAVINDDTKSSVSVLLGDPSHPGHLLSQGTYAAGTSPKSIVTADFNGDGWLDLATANSNGSVSVLLANPSSPGQFLPPTLYIAGTANMLVVADFNLDGLPDIAYVGDATVVLLNNPNRPGWFIPQPVTYPMGIPIGYPTMAAAADFNGDGYPDLAVNNPGAATVFFGDPAHPGQFLPQNPAPACTVNCSFTLLSNSSVAVGDFNGDGIPDFAVTGNWRYLEVEYFGVVVFLGDPVNRGSFLPPTIYGSGWSTGLVVGDFNGDGTQDLATLNHTFLPAGLGVINPVGSNVGILLGDPNHPGQFLNEVTYPSSTSLQPVGLAEGDFTGDGLPDLVFANGDQQSAQVLLNSSSATALAAGEVIGSGTQSLFVRYSGDSNYEPSTSATVNISGSVQTKTALTSSAFVVFGGDNVTFAANVSAAQGNPPSTGTVTFYDGSTNIATEPVNAQGIATFTTNVLTAGLHQISAAYGLSGIWLPSTSETLTIVGSQPGSVQPAGGLLFVPMTPCRVMDTRGNGFSGSFGPGSVTTTERDVPIQQSTCGIPGTAMAYALNVTAVPQGPLGYLSIWPTGLFQPSISILNSWDGRVVANAAIVPTGVNGSLSLYASSTTDVVIDINGYFTQNIAPRSLAFYPVTPCRVADTRGDGFTGAFGQPSMPARSDRAFPIQQGACQIPASAQAYSLNITAVPSGGPLYYLTAWPSGQPQPDVSTLNSFNGDVVANAAFVPAGTDGAIDLFVTNNTDVVIDIDGYFAPPGGDGALSFYPVTPCRIADTRGNGFSGSFGPPSLLATASRDFPLASSGCSLPAGVQAYSLNLTVVPPGPLGYLALWPTGLGQPVVSALNSFRGQVVANAAIVLAGANGSVSAFASNPTDLVIDVNGVFAP